MKVTITLATLPQATEQEVFDQVVTHMRQQGVPCLAPGIFETACAYRGGNGLMCAAGCLISDEEFESKGGDSWNTGAGWSVLVEEGVAPDAHQSLIGLLQRIHDTNTVEQWEYEFESLAQDFGLEYTPPQAQ